MNNHPGGRRDKAIISIVGKSVSYDSDGDTIIKWHSEDVPQPSEADIDAKIVELEAEWDAQAYARNRKAEYPDWGTQLEKIADDGIDAWKTDMLEPVKAKYPKP